MKVYTFDIQRTVQASVEVHAKNEEEAYEKAEKEADSEHCAWGEPGGDPEIYLIDEREYHIGDENI